ncbi:aKG-HExxH-type peptide beta-hydroxylase [Streptomyces antnestii]
MPVPRPGDQPLLEHAQHVEVERDGRRDAGQVVGGGRELGPNGLDLDVGGQRGGGPARDDALVAGRPVQDAHRVAAPRVVREEAGEATDPLRRQRHHRQVPPRPRVPALRALSHQIQLVDRATGGPHADALLYAPWRTDPRPPWGLLHGTYAFTGVADFWRTERHALTGPRADLAHFEFAVWRDAVAIALRTLADQPGLTPWGRRFDGGQEQAHGLGGPGAVGRRGVRPGQPERAGPRARPGPHVLRQDVHDRDGHRAGPPRQPAPRAAVAPAVGVQIGEDEDQMPAVGAATPRRDIPGPAAGCPSSATASRSAPLAAGE